MYTLKFWINTNSPQPEIRENMTYTLAYALATQAGYAKAQIISEEGIIAMALPVHLKDPKKSGERAEKPCM